MNVVSSADSPGSPGITFPAWVSAARQAVSKRRREQVIAFERQWLETPVAKRGSPPMRSAGAEETGPEMSMASRTVVDVSYQIGLWPSHAPPASTAGGAPRFLVKPGGFERLSSRQKTWS